VSSLDPRVTPARPDLAAGHLRGKVEARRFVEGTLQEVIVGIVPIRKFPAHDAPLLTEALYGERITIYETDEEGWAWGQLKSDGYVGYLPAAALLAPKGQPTHKVGTLRTFMFPGPSIKLPPMEALPLGARVAVTRQEESFSITLGGGYLPKRHLVPLAVNEIDFVAVAERFIGTPYLWGGKSSLGLDCSGLTQIAMTACGLACPRDSDMQEAAIGSPVSLAELRRGDLVFWKGHVAIARSASSLVHANAFHMAVAIEPVAEAIARIGTSGSEVTSVRRPK
jgi:cell wall-associated NlpC family hydrolase